ncbi:hypothetical protein E2C01_090889 [Portunus trituberculatus]|uniref:Uncharacterized protein n=1 Tax=Portunus trituberculatus TaxID=210409 RepID=A0A5B7JLJ4_PORTR|nr:hypothetical protein [Portunus trituberculatus]
MPLGACLCLWPPFLPLLCFIFNRSPLGARDAEGTPQRASLNRKKAVVVGSDEVGAVGFPRFTIAMIYLYEVY